MEERGGGGGSKQEGEGWKREEGKKEKDQEREGKKNEGERIVLFTDLGLLVRGIQYRTEVLLRHSGASHMTSICMYRRTFSTFPEASLCSVPHTHQQLEGQPSDLLVCFLGTQDHLCNIV